MLFNCYNKSSTCCFIEQKSKITQFNFNEEKCENIKFKKELKEIIVELIEKQNIIHYVSGVALGMEKYVAETVLELKKLYPIITLECVIPYETQAENWAENQRNNYFFILKNCDNETLMQYQYTNDCYKKANNYMIKKSNTVIFISNEESKNTGEYKEFENISGKQVFNVFVENI